MQSPSKTNRNRRRAGKRRLWKTATAFDSTLRRCVAAAASAAMKPDRCASLAVHTVRAQSIDPFRQPFGLPSRLPFSAPGSRLPARSLLRFARCPPDTRNLGRCFASRGVHWTPATRSALLPAAEVSTGDPRPSPTRTACAGEGIFGGCLRQHLIRRYRRCVAAAPRAALQPCLCESVGHGPTATACPFSCAGHPFSFSAGVFRVTSKPKIENRSSEKTRKNEEIGENQSIRFVY